MISELGADQIRSGKRKREDADLDITPMIDIVFLLLAFFVVVSKMDERVQINLPKASAGISVIERSAVILMIESTGTPDEPNIYKGKNKSPEYIIAGEPEQQEEAIIQYVTQELNGKQEQIKFALIKIDGAVRNRQVQLVKFAISKGLTEAGRSKEIQLFVAIEQNQDDD